MNDEEKETIIKALLYIMKNVNHTYTDDDGAAVICTPIADYDHDQLTEKLEKLLK